MPTTELDPDATPTELEAAAPDYEKGLEVGSDDEVYGTVYADDSGQFHFEGSRKDLVEELTRYYAEMLARHLDEFGADDQAMDPREVLAFMDARMNGRTWARVIGSVKGEASGTSESEPKEPTANSWETRDDGRLVLNGKVVGDSTGV